MAIREKKDYDAMMPDHDSKESTLRLFGFSPWTGVVNSIRLVHTDSLNIWKKTSSVMAGARQKGRQIKYAHSLTRSSP
ncbi:hypothetical protein DPMN_097440 [Dreissena polymorpha]|uniref:Uncharacterized protein n=1 Tax=Dreissena polymorpha TaxID=45954 RepID=A0A9D4LBS9_DREPO|nr:hypothetical protein DPMN_097440 [Dreissena polymorpha]